MPRQRRPLISLGTLLLAQKLFGTGFNYIPPVTLLSILIQAALYVGFISPPWDRHEVCLSGESILIYEDYRRLFFSALEHVDDLHLYYNMASFIIKGRTLERRYGSLKFLILLLVFIFSTSGLYVALAKAAYLFFDQYKYMKECAIGFSGVLFALKVLTSFESGQSEQWIYGFIIPAKFAVWAELLIIHLLVPRTSFIGHLAGILVGILYMEGPLRLVIDALYNLISPLFYQNGYHGPGSGRRSYTYNHGTASSSQSFGSQPHDYGWSRMSEEPPPTGSQPHDYGWSRMSEEPPPTDPEEVRRRRMNRFSL